MTLKDLERRNGHVVCVISPHSVALGSYYVKFTSAQVFIDTLDKTRKGLKTCKQHNKRTSEM